MTPIEARNLVDIANQIATQYPRAYSKCHLVGDPEAWDYIILVGQKCKSINFNVGCNGKRGTDELSYDAVAFMDEALNPTDVRVIDIVAGAGGSNPQIVFQDLTSFGPGKYIDPSTKRTHFNYSGVPAPTPIPIPTPPVKPPYPNEQVYWKDYANQIESLYRRAGRTDVADILKADPFMFVWWSRAGYRIGIGDDESKVRDEYLAEIKSRFGLP